MTEERKTTSLDTQTIDYFRMYKDLEGLYRTISIQLEEARKALEKSFLERDELKKEAQSLKERLAQLQEFVADELTNLSSCSQRDRQLESYMEQYKRLIHPLTPGGPLSANRLFVLSVDLDQFTVVNDRHGRPFGDHILRFVGQVITSRIRKCDIASRKGQRFSVVLAECAPHGALMKAREIILRIAQENFGESTGEQIQVTATVGLAAYDGKMDRDELLRRADCAMKTGKDAGHFCTVVYKEGGEHEVIERFPRNRKSK